MREGLGRRAGAYPRELQGSTGFAYSSDARVVDNDLNQIFNGALRCARGGEFKSVTTHQKVTSSDQIIE